MFFCLFSLIIIGFYINDNSLSGYFSLIKDNGYKSDFTQKYGYGLTFINMGVMGFVSIGFVMITGQAFNGPVLAALFTVVGFSANGKTVFNTLPILLGVLLASLGSKGSIFTLAISGLFGTALAPISGIFGPVAGIIAGWLHLAVVQNVGLVHGGLNLYNNGFSAGIVAGFLLPIFNMITDNNNQRKMNIQRKHMNFLKTVQANIKKRIDEKEDEEKKMKILDTPNLKFLKVGVDTDPLNNHNLEYLEKQNAIAALILNHSGDKVLFVNQYRAGVHNYIYEVPAGLIENGEEPIVALEREVREETGYKREDYDILYDSNTGFLVSPGYTTEKIYIYIIKLKSDDIVPLELDLDETENLYTRWIDIKDAGKLTLDMKTIFSLHIYANLIK